MLLVMLVGLLTATVTVAQTKPSPLSASLTITDVCEVLNSPIEWNGRLVEIRGVFGNALRPESPCPKSFATEGHVWPQAIDVRGVREKDIAVDPRLIADTYTFDDFIVSMRGSPRQPQQSKVVNVIGYLITREKYELVRTGYGYLGNGFRSPCCISRSIDCSRR